MLSKTDTVDPGLLPSSLSTQGGSNNSLRVTRANKAAGETGGPVLVSHFWASAERSAKTPSIDLNEVLASSERMLQTANRRRPSPSSANTRSD